MLSFKKGILNFQSEVYIYSTCTPKTVLDQHECVFKYDLVIENNVEQPVLPDKQAFCVPQRLECTCRTPECSR